MATALQMVSNYSLKGLIEAWRADNQMPLPAAVPTSAATSRSEDQPSSHPSDVLLPSAPAWYGHSLSGAPSEPSLPIAASDPSVLFANVGARPSPSVLRQLSVSGGLSMSKSTSCPPGLSAASASQFVSSSVHGRSSHLRHSPIPEDEVTSATACQPHIPPGSNGPFLLSPPQAGPNTPPSGLMSPFAAVEGTFDDEAASSGPSINHPPSLMSMPTGTHQKSPASSMAGLQPHSYLVAPASVSLQSLSDQPPNLGLQKSPHDHVCTTAACNGPLGSDHLDAYPSGRCDRSSFSSAPSSSMPAVPHRTEVRPGLSIFAAEDQLADAPGTPPLVAHSGSAGPSQSGYEDDDIPDPSFMHARRPASGRRGFISQCGAETIPEGDNLATPSAPVQQGRCPPSAFANADSLVSNGQDSHYAGRSVSFDQQSQGPVSLRGRMTGPAIVHAQSLPGRHSPVSASAPMDPLNLGTGSQAAGVQPSHIQAGRIGSGEAATRQDSRGSYTVPAALRRRTPASAPEPTISYDKASRIIDLKV